jgi:hypothetical protein
MGSAGTAVFTTEVIMMILFVVLRVHALANCIAV